MELRFTNTSVDLIVTKEKSRNMNLKFKSTDADLKFNFQSQFRLINQNILYLTRQVDLLVKWAKSDIADKNLQTQVDKYFDKDETSPQTDSDEQE